MLSETLFPRDEQNPQNLDRVAAYIQNEFERAQAVEVTEQPYPVNGRTYKNVLARFGPDTRERIVVGAHYDAAGPDRVRTTTRAAWPG
jgi:acetylornithine deacetylase/succinyl-diaminopimelate desuccinylase-like protein